MILKPPLLTEAPCFRLLLYMHWKETKMAWGKQSLTHPSMLPCKFTHEQNTQIACRLHVNITAKQDFCYSDTPDARCVASGQQYIEKPEFSNSVFLYIVTSSHLREQPSPSKLSKREMVFAQVSGREPCVLLPPSYAVFTTDTNSQSRICGISPYSRLQHVQSPHCNSVFCTGRLYTEHSLLQH